MKLSTRSIRRHIADFLATVCWFITAAVTALVLFAYLLPQDLTKTTQAYATLVQISFFVRVLTFQLALLLAGIAVLAVMLKRRWLLAVAGPISLALAVPTLILLMPHPAPPFTGPMLRLMSMNLKYTHRDGDRIAGQVAQFNPDVLVLEDYTPYSQNILEKAFPNDYPHRYLVFNYLQGLAIYSRYPFDGGHPRATFTKTRRQMRAVVNFHGQPIVIYIEHPFSPRTRQRIINNRLSTVDLADQIRAEKLPVIAAGDFNFTAETANEAALKATGLQDTFELAGHGRGSTWPEEPPWRQWLPGVRIDHIFASPQLTCTQFQVGQYDGSDHLPIVADLVVGMPTGR